MKYIFDFDDVLFNNSNGLKQAMYAQLEAVGISKDIAYTYYKTVREKKFSLKSFLEDLLKKYGKDVGLVDEMYENIMAECPNFTNKELVDKIDKLGSDNCFMVTNGELKFQKDKIDRANISHYFKEIFVVPGSKNEVIYDICTRYKDEKVIFVDDKVKFFEDLDLSRCPNLENILYSM